MLNPMVIIIRYYLHLKYMKRFTETDGGNIKKRKEVEL